MDVLKQKLDEIFQYQLQYHEEKIRSSVHDLETISLNLQKNFQTLNYNKSQTGEEYGVITDYQASIVFLTSILLPVLVHGLYYVFIACLVSIENLSVTSKIISSKRSKTTRKTSIKTQEDHKPAFIFKFDEFSAIIDFMMTIKVHSTNLIMDWIKQPEVTCGDGTDTSIKDCLANIRDLIHNLDEKNEESDMFITKSIEEGKIEMWETPLEYYDHLLEDIAESADKLRKIFYDFDRRKTSCGLSICFQLSTLCCTYLFMKKLKNIPGLSSVDVLAVSAGLVIIMMYVYQVAFIPMLMENIHHDSSILIENVAMFNTFSVVEAT